MHPISLLPSPYLYVSSHQKMIGDETEDYRSGVVLNKPGV